MIRERRAPRGSPNFYNPARGSPLYCSRMQTKKNLGVILLATLVTAPLTAADAPLKLASRPALTMALAQKMAMACIQMQRESNGPDVDIAIYNDGAKLIYFVSMDGTSSGTGTTAMAKAESAARFRNSTAEITKWVQGNPGVGHLPGLLGVRGGLPIFTASRKPLGGIGVSGAPSEVDEKCAQAGIDAIATELRDQ